MRTACRSRKLQHLELGYNPLGTQCVPGLLHTLATCPLQPHLRYLGLGCLGWEEDPALTMLFCAALPRFAPELEDLVVECNHLALASVESIAGLVLGRKLPRLMHLDLGDNLATREQTAGLAAHATSGERGRA